MINAPLSLANLLTVLMAFICFAAASRQSKGGPITVQQFLAPGLLAAIIAFVLLAGVFAATWQSDLAWLAGLGLGAVLGHLRGWRLSTSTGEVQGIVLLPATKDATAASSALILLAAIDFTSAYLRDPVMGPQYVAASAAFFAGFLGFRALAVMVRMELRARKLRQR